MNRFVIVRVPQGAKPYYVAGPGSVYSYTMDLTKARTFGSKESADRHACGNERVFDVLDLLRTPSPQDE